MGPKKDAMSEIIEEKVGAEVSDLRQDVQRVTQGMEKLQREIQTTIESIVAKQMESVVSQISQILAPLIKVTPEAAATNADRQRRALDGNGPSIGESSSIRIRLDQNTLKFPANMAVPPLNSLTGPPIQLGSFGNSFSNSLDYRLPQMEIPLFSGDNPNGWIARVKRYFLLTKMAESMKLDTAIVGLDGDALSWSQRENQRRLITSWAILKQMVLLRFRAVPIGSLSEELLSVVQTGTTKEYRVQWEMLASRVPDHILEGGFVKGLKEEIKATLHILQPQGLAHIMETAQRIEEGHQLMNSGSLLKPTSSKSFFWV
ncbi:uncharacterized protein LOC133030264 [Cannabis sativa]|uniref:uncharacterized protein LOC133030264 n=1 Tax=Cannabis sativa TaxID=3483 RepID=UPI0029C9E7C0|nr:uncharacterized protein LOC133030264 [Cannabis sativa]